MLSKVGFLIIIIFTLNGCAGMRPEKLGLSDGRLKSCVNRQNCVCSQDDPKDPSYVEPFAVSNDMVQEQVIAQVKSIALAFPRTTLVKETHNYLWIEFKTLLGFIDDVEFYYQAENQIIHFRSASRVGVYDLGKNRSRYNAIAKKLRQYFR